MKIGIYDPYLDDLGGGEKYMMTIAECLSKEHEVSVFWDHEEDLQELTQRFSLDLKKVTLTKNIFSPDVGWIEKILETKKYDAIFYLSDGSLPFVLAKRLFIHLQQPVKYIRTTSWKDKIKFSQVKGIFCNSQFTASFNQSKLSQHKIFVIYPPVELFPAELTKENIILHVGRFRVKKVNAQDYKKQGIMIETFKKMVDKKLKDWKFVIAASVKHQDKDQFALLQESAKGYPIEFCVNKKNKELWQLYNKAKIYWHASGYGEDLTEHPEYAEHFGIATVEAMGAGAVPVVINAGGQKEIVTDGENGLVWNTLEELAEKTIKVMEHEKTWKKLSDQARIRAKYFSKEAFSKRIHELVVK